MEYNSHYMNVSRLEQNLIMLTLSLLPRILQSYSFVFNPFNKSDFKRYIVLIFFLTKQFSGLNLLFDQTYISVLLHWNMPQS